MKVVVTIPTYNEKENILVLLGELEKSLANSKHEIAYLVVDDTSPDGTAKVVNDYRKTHRNVHIITGKKEGLGKALLRGMTEAFEHMDADVVLQMDADLSHDPLVAPKLLAAIDRGATFAVGSRYIPGGAIPDNWGAIRKIYSVVGNNIVRFGLWHPSVRDWTGGYRAYTRKFYEATHREMEAYSGYVFQIAFLHKSIHHGAKVTEIPFHFTDRRYGHSKIAPAEYIFNIYKYIATARMDEFVSGSFFKFGMVGALGFAINTLVLWLMVKAGMHPAVGSAVGAELAIISNFIFNNAWTFRERRVHGRKMIPKFLQFNLTSLGALIIQTGSVWAGTAMFGTARYFASYIVGVGLGLIWNYTMYSKVIWKK